MSRTYIAFHAAHNGRYLLLRILLAQDTLVNLRAQRKILQLEELNVWMRRLVALPMISTGSLVYPVLERLPWVSS